MTNKSHFTCHAENLLCKTIFSIKNLAVLSRESSNHVFLNIRSCDTNYMQLLDHPLTHLTPVSPNYRPTCFSGMVVYCLYIIYWVVAKEM